MDGKGLVKPVKVSPFIKLVRWGLLTYGIFYGQLQWEKYHRLQTHIRDEYEKIRPGVEEKMRAELLARKTDEIKKLAKEFGSELPPEWTAKDY